MATGNPTYGTDGLISSTLLHYRTKLEDVIFSQKVLLWLVKKAGIESQHGRGIVQPLLYGEITSKGSYADDDVFSAPTREGVTSAEFPWKHYRASIFFTGPELAQNTGKEAILKLVSTRVKQAELSVAEDVNRILFADGSGGGGKDFHGLDAIIKATGTYAGIDRADGTNAWWRGGVTAVGGALTIPIMRKAYNDPSEGRDQPTNILTTQEGYETYEGFLQGDVRHESGEMGDAGFQTLMYKAAPIAFDRACQDGRMYFLNFDYLKFVSLNGRWFDWSEWLLPVNQDAKYKNLYLSGNLTTTNAKRQLVLTGLSNA
jgi:hypothetical protein